MKRHPGFARQNEITCSRRLLSLAHEQIQNKAKSPIAPISFGFSRIYTRNFICRGALYLLQHKHMATIEHYTANPTNDCFNIIAILPGSCQAPTSISFDNDDTFSRQVLDYFALQQRGSEQRGTQ